MLNVNRSSYADNTIHKWFDIPLFQDCTVDKYYSEGEIVTVHGNPVTLELFSMQSNCLEIDRMKRKHKDLYELNLYIRTYQEIMATINVISRRIIQRVQEYNDVSIYPFPFQRENSVTLKSLNGIHYCLGLERNKWDMTFEISVLLGFLVFDELK